MSREALEYACFDINFFGQVRGFAGVLRDLQPLKTFQSNSVETASQASRDQSLLIAAQVVADLGNFGPVLPIQINWLDERKGEMSNG